MVCSVKRGPGNRIEKGLLSLIYIGISVGIVMVLMLIPAGFVIIGITVVLAVCLFCRLCPNPGILSDRAGRRKKSGRESRRKSEP